MKKDIKEFLPYYLGAEVIGILNNEPRKGYLTGIHGEYGAEIQFFEEDGINVFEEPEYNDYDHVMLKLRPLSSMTEEEATELISLGTDVYFRVDIDSIDDNQIFFYGYYRKGRRWWKWLAFKSLRAEQFHYLLSRKFDLFGLIDAGLAINAETIS